MVGYQHDRSESCGCIFVKFLEGVGFGTVEQFVRFLWVIWIPVQHIFVKT